MANLLFFFFPNIDSVLHFIGHIINLVLHFLLLSISYIIYLILKFHATDTLFVFSYFYISTFFQESIIT